MEAAIVFSLLLLPTVKSQKPCTSANAMLAILLTYCCVEVPRSD
jgi:hypothetical protein